MNLIIASLSLALLIATTSKDDEAVAEEKPAPDVMEAIRAAWKKREQDTPAIQASWDYHSPDQNGKRSKQAEVELTIFRDQLMLNYGYFRGIDGEFDEASTYAVRAFWKFTTIDGWRSKRPTDSEWKIRKPTVGTGLMSLHLFPFLYRGLHDEMTGVPFQEWKIDKKLLAADDDQRFIPIRQKQNAFTLVMLLDPDRDFVPVVSRVGNNQFRLPGSSDFTEVLVEWENDVSLPVPKRWTAYHLPKGVARMAGARASEEYSISNFTILHEESRTEPAATQQSAEPK